MQKPTPTFSNEPSMEINSELLGLKAPIKGAEKIAISMVIETLYKTKDLTYLEACVEFSEMYDYDITDIPKFISQTLLEKLEDEAINGNLIRNKKPSKGRIWNWV